MDERDGVEAESACVYCGADIERFTIDGSWIDMRSGDDGGTYDWCPDSPDITDNEPLQPHKARN